MISSQIERGIVFKREAEECWYWCTMTSGFPFLLDTTNSHYLTYTFLINPFTPRTDQCQIHPTASAKLLHHTVWRVFHSVPRWKMIILLFLTTSLIHFSLGRLGERFELGSEGWMSVNYLCVLVFYASLSSPSQHRLSFCVAFFLALYLSFFFLLQDQPWLPL